MLELSYHKKYDLIKAVNSIKIAIMLVLFHFKDMCREEHILIQFFHEILNENIME